MLELGTISKEEYDKAKSEKIEFKTRENSDGKAYHFVFYVREYLENKYGKDVVENGGLKVITTLDYDLQKKAEEVTKEGALNNAKKFGAGNSALIALDPKTGQILSMVGSRDYFDKEIDGKFNVALAPRQPGSTFKPFVYTLAFMSGLSPSTVLFDIPTEFSTTCDAYGNPNYPGAKCYMPVSYDGGYHGPTDLKHALQWSLNIPAVKLQYIVGLQNTLDFVKKLGISTLGSANRYGLSLVLGGGEVTLLELTNAYAVYANNGYLNPTTPILEVTDNEGNTLEKYTNKSTFAIPKEYTDTINNVLSDPYARVPAFSVNNPINFYDRQVAAKTGTTNDFKDVWVIGYTPSIVVGMWGGNNDNAPVTRLAGTVLSPVWRKFMDYALLNLPNEKFDPDLTDRSATPDFIKGIYCHDGQAHSILAELKGTNDAQYNLWNTPIQDYMAKNGCPFDATTSTTTDLIDNGIVDSSADLNMVNQVNNNTNTTIIPTTTSN
jgi:membrane peptidoglycan carboxypeptidase